MVSVLNALGSPTLQCVLGSRLFFNLKEAGERGVNEGTNWASYTLTGIDFSDPIDNAHVSMRYVFPIGECAHKFIAQAEMGLARARQSFRKTPIKQI